MSPAEPDELLAGLDEEQRTAVTSTAQPLCVLAGAGSGKTRVLTRRIAWRSATGLDDPRRVLALTFTRAAATELVVRLRALGVRDEIRAGTFHAVAWADLRARAAAMGRQPPVLVERPARLLARVADLDRGRLGVVEAELGWARARAIPLDRYPSEAARAGRRPALALERIVDIGVAYADEKRKRGAVDFDDLLEQAAAAIASDPAHAAAQRWRATHLYVDEFQDLNPLQHRLLEEWRGGRGGLTAVGDPNQAIYAWNGSDPAFIEQFTELYTGATVIAVDRNYRSVAPILHVANALLDAGDLGGVRVRPVREDGPAPVVDGYANEDDEAVAVARAVLDLRMPGTAWGRQAVLARTNALLAPVEGALRAAGVPVRTRGATAWRDRPVVRAVLRELPAGPDRFREAIARIGVRLNNTNTGPGHEPSDADADADADADSDTAALARLAELAERYLATTDRPDGTGFRAWLIDEGDPQVGDGVDVATFHAAKGREWPIVHLVGIEDGLVPLQRARTPTALAEERRLFYVACTRAEDQLRITWAATRRFGETTADRRPSPYLTEIAPMIDRARRSAAPPLPTAPPQGRPPLGSHAPAPAIEAARTASLREWRRRRARAAGIEPAQLLTDATLSEVAKVAPDTAAALAEIPGARPLVVAGLADEVLESLRG